VKADPGKGSREADMITYFYGNVESAYAALEAGTIDMVGDELSPDLVYNAIADANIVLGGVAAYDTYQFDLNNNYTTKDSKTYTSAMSYVEMRQAVAFLTDKDQIVSVFFGGFAERIDQPIAAPHKSWANESYWYPNYPYEYNPLGANTVLDSMFPEGATANPDYDALFPGSAQHIRTYPAGHEKAGQDLDPMIFCVRTDDNRRYQAGLVIVANMKKMGVPINKIEGTKSALYDRVMGDFNYHLYTGSWDVVLSQPPIYLYQKYHSSFCFPYGQNYVTGIAKYNPKYPKLDELLEEAMYALVYAGSVHSTKVAMGYFTEECIGVPLASSRSYWAWSKNLLGVVNAEGYGPENEYAFMNMYKADLSPIRYGLVSAPNTVNIVYSDLYWDLQCLTKMNLFGGISNPPYDPSVDQAGWVQDWTVDTWDDGGEQKTRLTWWLRQDGGYFCEPVTGNQKAEANTRDLFFSAWYMYQVGDSSWTANFKDLHHINPLDDKTIEIYLDMPGCWNAYSCKGPILPMDTWGAHSELVTKHTESFTEGITVTTPGDVNLAEGPVWIEYVKDNGVALTPYTDYNIVLGKLHIYVDIADGHTVEVRYWAVGEPRGYTPGNLAWQTIFEGAGMYYCTDFHEGVYGSATFKRNPFYWMETPLLGDIDFLWHWGGYDESRRIDAYRVPRTGCYQVDMLDLTIVSGAMNSQGTGVPDTNWFPGADLAFEGGVIDVIDSVTVTGNMGRSWGCTGPSVEAHDVAVTNIITSKTGCLPREVIGEERPIDINVTAQNQGDFAETFIVRVWANNTMIAEIPIVDLMPGQSRVVPLEDEVIGGTKGSIRVMANCTIVTGETDTADNTMVYGYIFQTLAGDIDGNRVVNIFDIVRMGGAYGYKRGQPKYDPNSDLDDNDVINIFDLVAAALNYGKNW